MRTHARPRTRRRDRARDREQRSHRNREQNRNHVPPKRPNPRPAPAQTHAPRGRRLLTARLRIAPLHRSNLPLRRRTASTLRLPSHAVNLTNARVKMDERCRQDVREALRPLLDLPASGYAPRQSQRPASSPRTSNTLGRVPRRWLRSRRPTPDVTPAPVRSALRRSECCADYAREAESHGAHACSKCERGRAPITVCCGSPSANRITVGIESTS